MGALLDLHIGFGYVLSHDTQAEKLQAADEDDDTDGGSPAWDRIIEDQLSDDDGYQDQKGKTGHGRSEPGGDGQRYLSKIDDAADGVFKQLPEVPFGLTGYAFDIFVGEPAGAETDPAEDSLGEAVVLTHGDDGIHHTALHQTEVSGAVHNICIRDLIDQLIKFPGKKNLKGSVSGTVIHKDQFIITVHLPEDRSGFRVKKRKGFFLIEAWYN